MSKILILGKIPPPVGGVTVHVSRLIEGLSERNFCEFEFCDLKNSSYHIILQILRHKSIHLHVSNPYIQLFTGVLCKVTFKKLLLTYHGDWGRYGYLANLAVNLSACLAYLPIVQNRHSLIKAKCWNRNATLISTYIPSDKIEPLNNTLIRRLLGIRDCYSMLFCTNAWNLTFDKKGKEIYGILDIILKINMTSGAGLIISDPSGNYEPYIKSILLKIPPNTHFIREKHDFRNILALSDAFIRNTTTDGVSLSVHEAIQENVVVFTSNAVERPRVCRLYEDLFKVDLEEELREGRKSLKSSSGFGGNTETLEKLISIYEML